MKKRIPIDPGSPDPKILATLGRVIRKGGVVAFPTDTYYGLAVNPFDTDALVRLFEMKGRDRSNPILLLVSSVEMLQPLVAEILPLAKKAMARFWPGPLTLVFKGARELPDLLMGGTGKIGIRIPDARLAILLIEAVGLPITATSANLSGRNNPGSAADVEAMLSPDIRKIKNVLHILDGGLCGLTLPSTVLDVSESDPRVLREGAISRQRLREGLGILV
ncbi:MAG: L-threonylcarbamoyladenylate synthase [Nitrospira sp.]|nr:threonylcarbamoyl-AMP synthase [Candidatus Manganitrophaceae bacterium]HIL34212.1 threonylcarbamoyl-AMP synthase [Candidatus Manganitrophaceae bacterium]